MSKRACTVDGCGRPHTAKGYCAQHYQRAKRGSPVDTPIAPMRMFKTTEESFANRTEQHKGCTVWTGAMDQGGYGMIWHDQKFKMAHRYAWERANGPIPKGMYIDHMCFTRNRVDLAHLRLATPQENVQNRSVAGRRSLTGVRNVARCKEGFRVRIMKDGKRINFGTYASLPEAEAVARQGRKTLFGEFSGDTTSRRARP